jgi:malate dehydrogenase (oxaloacetate-decarboxylating)(NADP+)
LTFQPEIIDPKTSSLSESFAKAIHAAREKKGVTRDKAEQLSRDSNVFGLMLVRSGQADGMVTGLNSDYPNVLRAILQHIPMRPGATTAVGVFIVITGNRVRIFADSLVNIDPGPEELAEITLLAAEFAQHLHINPRVAMVSYSNFGASNHPAATKVREALKIVRERQPGLMVDGEMQADFALSAQLCESRYPDSTVKGANVLIFPNLDASTVAFKVAAQLGGSFTLGPVLLGPERSVHLLNQGMDAESIALMGALAVVESQELALSSGGVSE